MKAGTSDLLTKAAKQFDPSDPTSPMAKHAADLGARQQKLTEQMDQNHADVVKKVDELMTALKVPEAKARLAKVTPIKGDTFENQVNAVLSEDAGRLGDKYTDTRSIVGSAPRSKKGDGVLHRRQRFRHYSDRNVRLRSCGSIEYSTRPSVTAPPSRHLASSAPSHKTTADPSYRRTTRRARVRSGFR